MVRWTRTWSARAHAWRFEPSDRQRFGGLSGTQSGGMGEGWSDLFAFLLDQNRPTRQMASTQPGLMLRTYAVVSRRYVSNYFYGIRRFPYAAKSVTGGPSNRPTIRLPLRISTRRSSNLTDGAFPCSPLIGGSTALPRSITKASFGRSQALRSGPDLLRVWDTMPERSGLCSFIPTA